ncbi:Protein GufA [Hyella patelloides LEGE 07179]|uniref:Protein GufA n=1 Tax=Hyella patelloides LEGE 07179 TaxID=945734 RepID=A0A563VRD5_9CYAN|nr:ZIP family metal transporter [Hyella patelloides]VEP13940.1 Protein GufA [Hyella patelloides LEGE 07179]
MGTIYLGFVASLIAGLGTSVGALPILFAQKLDRNWQGLLLGIGGGIMLAATTFSLIIPGQQSAIALGYSDQSAALIISLGIILGAALLWLIHNNFPHEHFNQGPEGKITENFQRIWLFVLAITLHNFPEGLAVGVGFGNGEGLPLALGIGLQNMPEGLVVALALRELNYSVAYAFGISSLTGLVEPIGGIAGASIVSVGQIVLPWAMAAAAGAMLFVIVDEIIPEIDRESITQEGTLGIMTGFVTMMFLDMAYG